MKLNKITAAFALLPFAAIAQEQVPAIQQHPQGMESPLPLPPVPLSDREREALRLVREWKKAPDKPRRAADGSVKYLFGATLPTLVCAPLRTCAIRLQEGEVVNNVNVGDSPRWVIEAAEVGSGNRKTVHAIVTPREAGVSTNVIIATDRRVYTIALKAAKHEWMPFISFDYPDDTERSWAAYYQRQAKAVYGSTLATGESVGDLDFGFRLSGDSPKWKPIRVYIKGDKTEIQFPRTAFADELPVLVLLGKEKMFSDSEMQSVNYRIRGDKFVVDKVITGRAALISGVGSNETRVIIEYVGKEET